MKNMIKIHGVIAFTLAFGILSALPANALQVTAAINMSAPTITVTDLNSSDGISPQIILSNLNSNAGWSWLT